MLLKQMKYFSCIVDCGSFTEAAEQCFISQSAISQQICALEQELGVKLTQKSGRKFTVTSAGEYFYQRSKAILQSIEEITQKTHRIGSAEEAHLHIGYLSSYDGGELQGAIIELAKTYPEVIVNVSKGTHEDLYHRLKDGKITFVLNDQRRAFSDEYENFILNQTPAYIEVASTHPFAAYEYVTTKQLEDYACILVATKGQESTEQDFYENTLGIGKQFLFAESLDEARLLAMSGRGYLLVESLHKEIAQPLVRMEVRRESGISIVRTYCAFWKKANTNYYIEKFADLLRKKFSE